MTKQEARTVLRHRKEEICEAAETLFADDGAHIYLTAGNGEPRAVLVPLEWHERAALAVPRG
jgi:hypothetical protein